MKKIDVLDHGFVRLVDHMGNDTSIVRSARVSYNAAWRAGTDSGSDCKLIHYLMANGHNTPFESVTFTFEVKAPIFVIRQWQRHRTQSYNEVSARYTKLPTEYYVPELEHITTQSTDNKQVRTNDIHPEAAEFNALMHNCNESAFSAYEILLKNGCPRELARTVLPLSTYTHMFTTMNLHNLFKFLEERMHYHAQYEIRVYAEAIYELILSLVPTAVEAFNMKRAGFK